MNMNVQLTGLVEKIIESAVARGVVKTKAEAVRLGVLELNDKFGLVPLREDEVELAEDLREIERIERDLASGKEKLHKVKSIDKLLS